MKFFFYFFFTLIIFSSFVGATRISYLPPRDMNFEPNMVFSRSYGVTNDRGYDMNLSFEIVGDLKEYATIPYTWAVLKSGEKRYIPVTATLPETLEKSGWNSIGLRAVEVPKSMGGGLGAYIAVIATHRIYVPYPGIYLDTSLRAENVKENQPIVIEVDVINRGQDSLNGVFSSISIFDMGGNKVDSMFTNQLSLTSQESGKLTASFVRHFSPGEYKIIALTSYGGETKEDVAHMNVGTLYVSILNYTTLLNKNSIQPFNINIQSKWNDPIENVYARVVINNLSQEKVTEFKTPPENLNGFEIKNLEGFFNTNGLSDPDYITNITVYYEGRSTTKIDTISLSEKLIMEEKPIKIDFFTTTNLLTITVIMMMIMLLSMIFLFIWVFKNKRKK